MFRLIRIFNIFKLIRSTWKYFRNKEIPQRYKIIPIIGFIYVLNPLDLVSEIRIPSLGIIDDVFVLYMTLLWFEKLSKKYIESKEHINTEYEVKEEEDE
jgi:uncharacterized membrane protein YkvA (DUF1232 family)